MKFIAILLLIPLASCTSLQHGDTKFTAVGGRGLVKTKGKDGMTLVYDNQKSFRDLMVFMGVAASAGATAYGQAVQAGVDKATIAGNVATNQATQETIRNTTNVAGELGKAGISANTMLEAPSDTVGIINAVKP